MIVLKLNIQRLMKRLKKLNFATIFFFLLSLVSTTFAWFAFRNVVDNDMNIGIKAWQIDIDAGGDGDNNIIDISTNEFYPGGESTFKTIILSNSGDLSAQVSYKIKKLRILDEEFDVSNQELIFDQLSQTYPFTINFSLSDTYIDLNNTAEFSYSIEWPLDSGDDEADAEWGMKAYDFITSEQDKKEADSSYEMLKCIDIQVELVVEQFVDTGSNLPDENYVFGKEAYLNFETFESCLIGEENCHTFTVVEKGNLTTSQTVRMLASPNQDFSIVSYNDLEDNIVDLSTVLNLISSDVVDTKVVVPGLSDRILGNVYDFTLYNNVLNRIKEKNGYIVFSKDTFDLLKSDECYWVYDENHSKMAVKNLDDNLIKLYFEEDNMCKKVPMYDVMK